MPTLYGSRSYSLRRINVETLLFEIGSKIAARVVLRPPLAAALRSVMLNGIAHSSFDGDSVTLYDTPAEVGCSAF